MKYECGEMRAARMGSTLKRLKFCVFGSFMREWDMDGVKVIATAIDRSNMKVVYQNKSMAYKVSKRLFDILLAGIALVCLSPIFLVTALAIKLEDGGTVIFRQERNGLNGNIFTMYKFRSMCVNASDMHKDLLDKNELDGPAFKMKDDPRVTKVGRFIRKTSIDELPQLINILKGEMSIVGPRPLPTYETEKCTDYQKQRLLAKPGLTCYWQCSGRNSIPFDEWMEMDLKYLEEASFLIDLKIILKTVGSVFLQIGAY